MARKRRAGPRLSMPPKRRQLSSVKNQTSAADVTTERLRSIQHDHNYALTGARPEPMDIYLPGNEFLSCPNFFLFDDFDMDIDNTCDEAVDLHGGTANEFYLIARDGIIQHAPHEDTDILYCASIYRTLRKDIVYNVQQLTSRNNFCLLPGHDNIRFFEAYPGENPSPKMCFTLGQDLRPQVFVHKRSLPPHHECFRGLPAKFTTLTHVSDMLTALSEYGVCVGNPEASLLKHYSVSSSVSYLEGDFGAVREQTHYTQTVRSNSCSLLTKSLRCSSCCSYRSSLRKLRSISESACNTPYSKKPHKNMSPGEITSTIQGLRRENRRLSRENDSVKRRLEKLQNASVNLSENDNDSIQKIIEENKKDFDKVCPEGSFQRLFFDQQCKYNSLKNKKSMRWHPMLIKWALYIKSKSTKAYEAMRDAGFIAMPSSRTLFDYSHYTKSTCGITTDVVTHCINEAKSKGLFDEDWKRYVGLLQDEVKVKEDLVYDKHTGELVGYVDLDKTGNQLLELEKEICGTETKIAKSMLVIMIRGIATDFKFPLAAYATNALRADLLCTILWPAIEVIETTVGLKVLFITCDGAAANRRFFSIHGDSLAYFTVNPFDRSRNIYFVSDVPHLLKTTRNCFANSDSHKMSRKLWKDGKPISWMHIVDLYKTHCEKSLYTRCPKLTRNHIDLTAFTQMRVNLAAQVLSETVANALDDLYGPPVERTSEFIRLMNKFFDCMNTRSLSEGTKKKNSDLNAYTDTNDPRLEWLEKNFLGYFEEWQRSVDSRPGPFSKEERNAMLLSQQTLKGLEMTTKSIVECVRFLLKAGVPFVLTNHFNQDPLEQHFGHYRHKGGSNDNPTIYQARHTMTAVRTVGSVALASVRGNTQHDRRAQVIDETAMPKRKVARV